MNTTDQLANDELASDQSGDNEDAARNGEAAEAPLRDEREQELARRRAFVLPAGIPRVSLGALFMPPIWGAAHGQWATMLFYPLWVFADSVFMTAYRNPTGLRIGSAVVMFLMMAAVTIFFAATSQKPAYYRVKDKYTPEQYIKRERIWTITMILVAIVFIIAATYFNLVLYDVVWKGMR